MTHYKLSLYLMYSIKSNTNHDYYGRSAKIECVDVHEPCHHCWNYSYYREKKKDLEEYEKDRNGTEEHSLKTEVKKEEEAKPAPKKQELSAGDEAKMEHLEMEIGRQEATLAMYTAQMSMNPDDYENLAREYEEAKSKLDELYEKWSEIAAKAED